MATKSQLKSHKKYLERLELRELKRVNVIVPNDRVEEILEIAENMRKERILDESYYLKG